MPIWLTLILALPQIIKFVKDLYDLWKEVKKVPKENRQAATEEFKCTVEAMKVAKSDDDRKWLLERLRERVAAHRKL